MSTTITITRAERDLIRESVTYWMPTNGSVTDPVPFSSRDEANDSIRKFERAVVFYDELGWEDDDQRNAFVVTVDQALVEVIRGVEEAALDEIRMNSSEEKDLTDPYSSKPGSKPMWTFYAESLDDARKQAADCIAAKEHELQLCEGVRERINAEAAAFEILARETVA